MAAEMSDIVSANLTPAEKLLSIQQGVPYITDADFFRFKDKDVSGNFLFQHVDKLCRRALTQPNVDMIRDNSGYFPAGKFFGSSESSEWYRTRLARRTTESMTTSAVIRLTGVVMVLDAPKRIPEFNIFMQYIRGKITGKIPGTKIPATELELNNLHILLRLICGMMPSYSMENIIDGYTVADLVNLKKSLRQYREQNHGRLSEDTLNEEFDMLTTPRGGTPTRIYVNICIASYMSYLCIKIIGNAKITYPTGTDTRVKIVGIIMSNNPSLKSMQGHEHNYTPCEIMILQPMPVLLPARPVQLPARPVLLPARPVLLPATPVQPYVDKRKIMRALPKKKNAEDTNGSPTSGVIPANGPAEDTDGPPKRLKSSGGKHKRKTRKTRRYKRRVSYV